MKKLLLQTLFFFNLILILFFWYQGSGEMLREGVFAGIMIAIGRISGLLAEFLILTQLVLIGRIRWIEKLFSHNEMVAIHKTVGKFTALFLVLHPILLVVGWGKMTESGFLEQFVSFIKNWDDVFSALVGLIIFTLAILFSLNIFRKKLKYEHWHLSHLFIYIAIALAFNHQTNTGDLSSGAPFYYWLVLNFTVFGLMLFFRFAKPLFLAVRHNFKIDKIVAETSDVWSIYITGKNLDKFSFKAGQFAEINFLKFGLWTPHPFSFSSAPNGKYLRFTVKALGDFTNRIKELTPGTRVIIDGPLGSFTEDIAKTGKYLFIAGGVGITPIAGMIESLNKKNKTSEVCLLYCVRSAAQIPFRQVFDKLPVKTFYIVSDQGAGDGGDNYLRGYIDAEKIKKLCPSFHERDIYFCGPPKMSDLVLKILHELNIPSKQIHYEKFSF